MNTGPACVPATARDTERCMTDIQIYADCIARLREHLAIVDAVNDGRVTTGCADLNAELVAIRFRKALEELAFASLSANREQYAAARAGFATEWNARRMLGFVKNVNPHFYPIALKEPREIAKGQKHFDLVEDGYLTQQDFATLYDGNAEVLHCRNPYASGPFVVAAERSTLDWSNRIKTLLRWHFVQLVNVPGVWLVEVPNEGPVRAFLAMADGNYVFDPSGSKGNSSG
jgi:hypothetical protein